MSGKKKSPSVEEQIEAAALGTASLCKLFEGYLEDKNELYFLDRHIQFDTVQLAEYFQKHLGLASRLVTNEETKPNHDMPILLKDDSRYRIAWMNRGNETDVKYFDNLAEAAASYIMSQYGF